MSDRLVVELGPGGLHRQADVPSVVFGLLRRIPVWVARHRQRKALAELSDHLLKDIGVSHATALREAGKPFWQ